VASILPSSINDCCNQCCEVNIVDLPVPTSVSGVNFYDTVAILRQESRAAILVDDTPAQVYDRPNLGAGNSGFYLYDASDIQADDGISVVVPNSVIRPAPGSWLKWKG